MTDHPLKKLIQDAEEAISKKDFDGLMRFYADDAILVVRPGMTASGKDQIRNALHTIEAHFDHAVKFRQGKMEVLEAGDTALVVMDTILEVVTPDAYEIATTRRATYVFRRSASGEWLCAIDNAYGTGFLDE
jgi:uncharacterized protein (TIGR02246 family)